MHSHELVLTPEQQAEVVRFREACKAITGSPTTSSLHQILRVARSMYGPRPAESRRRPLTDYRVTDEERAAIRARLDELARTEG
jgi:hypothetical protein